MGMMYKVLSDVFPDCTQKLFDWSHNFHGVQEHYYPAVDLKAIAPELFFSLEEVFKSKMFKTRIFVTPPKFVSGVHIDGISLTSGVKWAANFPISGTVGSTMEWYSLHENEEPKFQSLKWDNSVALVCTPNQLDKVIETVELITPMLVNTMVPHNTRNMTDTPRVILSCRFERSSRTSFEEEVRRLEANGL